jgi:hypothetical protein
VFFEASKDFMDDLPMFLESGASNEDVIEIDCYFPFSNQICEYSIHQRLECGVQIGEPEEHDVGFEKTFIGDKGCLSFIAFFNLDIMIAPPNIKLGEDFSIPKLVDYIQRKQ